MAAPPKRRSSIAIKSKFVLICTQMGTCFSYALVFGALTGPGCPGPLMRWREDDLIPFIAESKRINMNCKKSAAFGRNPKNPDRVFRRISVDAFYVQAGWSSTLKKPRVADFGPELKRRSRGI